MIKKIAGALVLCVTLAGCASGPEKGYYDNNGVYHPSASAQNKDRAETAGAVAIGAASVAALAVAIHAATK